MTYRVVRFAGYEILAYGETGHERVDWHVVDEHGRSVRVFVSGEGKSDTRFRRARRHAARLNEAAR